MGVRSTLTTFSGLRAGDVARHEDQHIVDQLIAERGITLVKHPLWPVLKPFVYSVLHYRKAVEMADAIAGLSGADAFQHVSDLLKLKVTVNGRERLPETGGFVMVSNHPTGIPDGIALFDVIKGIRDDLVFFANRDAVRVSPRLADIIIPVEWRQGSKTHAKSRQTLVQTNRAFKDGRAVALFPSGRISYWYDGGLRERPWQATGIQLAKRYNVPIVPMHMTARNSGLFYLLSHRNVELRDMTVFHELLNKKGKPFHLNIGRPIMPDDLEGDVQDLTVKMQHYCEQQLKTDHNAKFML
ncbi:MAG: 1-acyl-sn-glycerol-3-phosphate acyltransferase [Pseudomonadota bacterium]